MKVKELIERLKEFDGELEVAICTWEQTNKIEQVRVETQNNHCYDKADHILEIIGKDKCVMIADEELPLDENNYGLKEYTEDEED